MLCDSKGREVVLVPKFAVCGSGMKDGTGLEEREIFETAEVGK